MTDIADRDPRLGYPDDREWHNVPGPSYQKLIDADRYEVPAHMRERSPGPDGMSFTIPRDRYLRQDVHDAEIDDLWMRVWQMACRVEQVARVGDSVLYEIAGRSFIVVRSDPDTIKCFPNTCLHRGRVLRECDGKIGRLRCPYHGFTWALDGGFVAAPAKWDYDQTPEELQLPEAQVGIWGGNVFINPDPDAEPLEDFLGDIGRHFERCGYDNWSLQAQTAKASESNWKEAVEAFIEAHHVFATHPQAMLGTDPDNSQYDIWKNYARIILPMGKASAWLGQTPSQQRTMNGMMGSIRSKEYVKVPDGMQARHHFADMQRSRFRQAGLATDLSDAEMTDLLVYWIFPNIIILAGPRGMVIRFRPGNGPDKCVTDVMALSPMPPKEGAQPPACRWLGEDETFTGQDDLPGYGLLDQDLSNLPTSHTGLRNLKRPLILGKYQESVIAYFHELIYNDWLAGRGM
jgi:phenylpropionate dioxygenase-like ring-hydroxylating dioxygenase large terminal subunit